MAVRRLALLLLILSSACVRQRITQDFGLPGNGKVPRIQQKAPDAAVRAIFQKQKINNSDPLANDARVQELQARLKANPKDLAAHLELGAINESYNLFDAASEQYTQTLQFAASVADADNVIIEQATLGFARMAQSLGQVREVSPVLERFAKERASANAWNQLGLLRDSVAELAAGEKAFREAIALNKSSDRFYNNLGYNLLLQKKTESAADEFRKALELNPASAMTRNNLGVALARLGDLQGALQEFESAAADPATAHNNLAVVLLGLGQYEQSRDELVKALQIRNSFAPALENFKLVQARIQGQADGAHAK
jgi:tetratricopeptide (TPR) repeat protein